MEHFQYFAAAYFVLVLIFFIYVGKLQKKIKSIQSEINQLKNK